MCNEYDCNNSRPLGLQDAENAWNEHQRKAATAMTSDIYTNGGLLDRTNAMGYEQPAFYPSTTQQILERDFSYEELKFIAGARMSNMSMADIDRLISILEKLKKSIKNIPVNGLSLWSYAMFIVLSLIPFLFEIREAMIWKLRLSKI